MKVSFPRVLLALGSLAVVPAEGIIFTSTDDPSFNTNAPTGVLSGSGWDFQGDWLSFLGTPIAPQYFITAKHIGGGIGNEFAFRGRSYVTDSFFEDPGSDLRIWHVTTEFPAFAPLYFDAEELGKELVVFGRGRTRGAVVASNGGERGWLWGTADGLRRWGTNRVTEIEELGSGVGDLLSAEFNLQVSATEAHLAVGDSGGAVFIRDDDAVWKLAGINYSVTGPYATDAFGNGSFEAALYDQSGFFVESTPQLYTPAVGAGAFQATRISAREEFIRNVTGIPEPSVVWLLLAAAPLSFRRARRSADDQ